MTSSDSLPLYLSLSNPILAALIQKNAKNKLVHEFVCSHLLPSVSRIVTTARSGFRMTCSSLVVSDTSNSSVASNKLSLASLMNTHSLLLSELKVSSEVTAV